MVFRRFLAWETCFSPPPSQGGGRRVGLSMTGASAPITTTEVLFGKTVFDRETKAQAEVCGARLHPLQHLRALAGRYAPLRYLPYLFPRKCFAGQTARREKVELVKDEE